MTDDKLSSLSRIELPEPSAEARQRALEKAMLAFERAREESSAATQGSSPGGRLRSIVQPKRGNWIMDTRIGLGLGTAAVALLLLPLGYQLYTTTAITPIGAPPVVVDQTPPPPSESQASLQKDAPAEQRASGPAQQQTATNVPVVTTEQSGKPEEVVPLGAGRDREVAADEDDTLARPPVPASAPLESNAGMLAPAAPKTAASGQAQELAMEAAPPPAGGLAAPEAMMMPSLSPQPPTATTPSGDQFTQFAESPVKVVAEEPVSTFSIDVDTASYSYVRSALEEGWMPEPDAVRIEEMINYFSYGYPGPETADTPFRPTVAIYPTPWNPKTRLLQIGIKGYAPPATEDAASNLVFLIDTSGSMDEPDKLPLLKRAFALLVDQLTANDTVSIVVYAGSAGVVLEPTRATDKARILAALDQLSAGGSTAGAEGIELAYRMAEQGRIGDGINRVILATDGDFNVGIDDPEDLKTYIKQKRDSGISLSVLGFGQGNLGDDTMQALAQNGNGNASYIDSFREAQKVLVAEGGSTLQTIAKDVKIQIEFNPAFVSEYRLIGYETRALNREDFNNDKVDAGDIGAGHTVTAIYEITPAGSGAGLVDPLRYGDVTTAAPATPTPEDEIGFLKLRYKLPNEDTSKLMDFPITRALAVEDMSAAGEDQRWAAAVAAFAQKLKGSSYGEMSWDAIRALAQDARGSDEAGYRAEFMQLIDMAKVLAPTG